MAYSIRAIPDFTLFYKGTDLSGIMIGVPRNCFNTSTAPAPIMTSLESALKVLGSARANVVDNANFAAVEEFKNLRD